MTARGITKSVFFTQGSSTPCSRQPLISTISIRNSGAPSSTAQLGYASGRGNDWVKKTCAQRETLSIAGFALDGKNWDGIYLGRRNSKRIAHKGVWVEPDILAEIEYRAKSAEGKVRHPVYRGLREDL